MSVVEKPFERVFLSATRYASRKRLELLILVSMIGIYAFSFFQRVAVPGTIFDELQSAFGASAGAVAGLGAVYLYIYGIMQPVTGVLTDRLGSAKVLLGGGALLAVGSILFPLADSVPMLYAARVLVGLGASLVYISIIKAIDELFGPEHFVVFVGVTIFLGYTGGLVGTFPFERLATAIGWRRALLLAGAASAVAFLGALVLIRRAGRLAPRPPARSMESLRLILSNRAAWPNLFIPFGNFAVFFLVQAMIGKKFLSDYCGLSSAASAGFTCAMMLTQMCLALTGGLISRLLGNRRRPLVTAAVGCVLTAILMILAGLHFHFGSAWFLASYILLAFSSIGSAAGTAVMKELSPPQAVGASVGILNAATYIAVAIVAHVAGIIMDRYSDQTVRTAKAILYPREAYVHIFLFCAVLAGGALILSFFIRETHGRNIYAARG